MVFILFINQKIVNDDSETITHCVCVWVVAYNGLYSELIHDLRRVLYLPSNISPTVDYV